MPPKLIRLDRLGQEIKEPKAKPKPKVYDPWWLGYFYKRDMIWLNDMFTDSDTKELIEIRIKENYYER